MRAQLFSASNVIQIYVPSDSLFTALHLHYVELKNRNRDGLWFYEIDQDLCKFCQKVSLINQKNNCVSPCKVCGHPVQKAEVRVWPAQSQPQDCLQGKLQISGPGKVPSQPGRHHAAAGRGVLEVTQIL